MKQTVIRLLKPIARPIVRPIRKIKRHFKLKRQVKEAIALFEASAGSPRVIYLGVCCHSNLGDMAQFYCIENWINRNYPDHRLIKIESHPVCETSLGLIDRMKSMIDLERDIIVFQSGYTTQDLGGNHDLMHRLIIEAMPQARILMMPQTIFFQHEENRALTSRIYNRASNMLFLARDLVSYNMALKMFPDVRVQCYPDIVTSLIGQYDFSSVKREGVGLCRRDDGEKLYSDSDLEALKSRIETETGEHVVVNDTTLPVPFEKMRANRKFYIDKQITEFAQLKALITDRYHGTIFALAAGTPVIIIKTTDHKVVTGADWFKGVYDDHIYVADDLNHAYEILRGILANPPSALMKEHFGSQYYNLLKSKFDERK